MTAIASSLLFATAAHAAVDLIAVGQLSGLTGDLSKETAAPLENGVAGNLLGSGIGNSSVQNVFSAIPIAADQNAINYNFGEQPTAGGTVSKGQAATMGFWQNKNGQGLVVAADFVGTGIGGPIYHLNNQAFYLNTYFKVAPTGFGVQPVWAAAWGGRTPR